VRIKNMIPAHRWWAAYADNTAEPLIGWATVDFGGDDQYVRGLVVIDGEVTDAEQPDNFAGYLPYEPYQAASANNQVRATVYVQEQIKKIKEKET
jgi:hypothetical protein